MFGDSLTLGVQTILQLIFCGCAAFVVFVLLPLERLSLRSIGLQRPGWPTLTTALLLAAIGFVMQPLVTAPLVKAFGQAGAEAGVARLAILPGGFDSSLEQRAVSSRKRCIAVMRSSDGPP